MQKHIHLPNFPPSKNTKNKMYVVSTGKYSLQGKSLSSKKGKIKAIYCYAAQHCYMRLLQMKDIFIMHAAK